MRLAAVSASMLAVVACDSAPTPHLRAWESRFETAGEDIPSGCSTVAGWHAGKVPQQQNGKILWQKTVVQPNEQSQMLKFLSVDQLVQVYLGRALIYEFGDPAQPKRTRIVGNTLHLVHVPGLAQNTPLCFRIFSRKANKGLHAEIRIAPEKIILRDIFISGLTRITLIPLILASGLILIVMFFFSVPEKAFLPWGMYLSCFALWSLSQTEIKQLITFNPGLWRVIDIVTVFQFPIWIGLFIERIFGPGKYGVVRIAWRMQAAYATFAWVCILFDLIDTEHLFVPYQISIVLILILFSITIIILTFRGDREARLFLVSALIFGLTGLYDTLVALNLVPWAATISIWGAIPVLVSGIIILVRRLSASRLGTRDLETQARTSHPLFVILQTKFALTYQEAQICADIDEGIAREDIAQKLKIQATTLKIHLKSIYAKTMGRSTDASPAHRDKLQRLTVFLKKLHPPR